MKWLKHMANASSNEDIVEIEAIFGLEGYARWWKLLEAVALQMDKSDRCSVAYPWSKWQEILKGKRKKLETFLGYLAKQPGMFPEHSTKQPLIFLKQTGEILEIKIPKLLKYRDDYSKKSGQTPEPVRTKEVEAEAEEDSDVEVAAASGTREAQSPPPAPESLAAAAPLSDLEELETYWASKKGRVPPLGPGEIGAIRTALALPGASVALVKEVVERRLEQIKAKGRERPSTFGYFHDAIRDEAERRGLMSAPVQTTPGATPPQSRQPELDPERLALIDDVAKIWTSDGRAPNPAIARRDAQKLTTDQLRQEKANGSAA